MQVTDAEIYMHVRDHDDTMLTASKVADQFDLRPTAAYRRLEQLTEKGKITKQMVGAVVVWDAD
jgi:predicted ArsR family transcriptional regulator